MEENNRNEMEQNQVTVSEQKDDGKLTTSEKWIVGGAVCGIGLAGYLLGTYIVAPIVNNIRYTMAERKADEDARKRGKKRSKSGVEFDEDADFKEVDQEEDEEK